MEIEEIKIQKNHNINHPYGIKTESNSIVNSSLWNPVNIVPRANQANKIPIMRKMTLSFSVLNSISLQLDTFHIWYVSP